MLQGSPRSARDEENSRTSPLGTFPPLPNVMLRRCQTVEQYCLIKALGYARSLLWQLNIKKNGGSPALSVTPVCAFILKSATPAIGAPWAISRLAAAMYLLSRHC